jgi:apolipoprotein N-acyltransferase
MTTMTVPRTSPLSAPKTTVEPTAHEIISQARTAAAPAKGAWIVSGATALLTWAAFTPLDWGPLAWVCLVPVLLLIRLPRPTRWMYRALYGASLVCNFFMLQWMRLGDASMYPAWLALSVYLALYLPVFVAVTRVAVQRVRVPLVLAVPVVWVGLEFLQAHLMTGFAWYYLGHTQYAWLEMIQISDITGAYGVSFVVAMTSAAIAGLVPGIVFQKLNLLPGNFEGNTIDQTATLKRKVVAVTAAVVVFAGVLTYGYVRRSQATWTMPDARSGPRVALVQGNFTSKVKHDPMQRVTMLRTHDVLTGMAVRHQPDVIVLPETMFGWPLQTVEGQLTDKELLALAPAAYRTNPKFDEAQWIDSWRSAEVTRRLRDDADRTGAAMIIGIVTKVASQEGLSSYNSAAFVTPSRGLSNRYDKIHRVVFGEYIPLREQLPFLRRLTPYAAGFGIDAGTRAAVFKHKGWTFSPVICFEDTVPHLVRNIVKQTADKENGGKTVDVLVNLTNDGWFHGSSELDQHLITAVFRSVECRTPTVRAVNTGISSIIDGDGAVVEPDVFLDGRSGKRSSMRDPKTGRWRKGLEAALIHRVPLDERTSLYVHYGDWFASICLFSAIGALLVALFVRRRNPQETATVNAGA